LIGSGNDKVIRLPEVVVAAAAAEDDVVDFEEASLGS
jgi:hypothetical protein